MPPADNFTREVLARFRDFVDPATPWQRRLWDVGFVMSLNELREAADAVPRGVLSKASVKAFALSIEQRAKHDPGAGSGEALGRLRALLRSDLTAGGAGYTELGQWTDDVAGAYLDRWMAAVSTTDRPSKEAIARALAAHLLGERFSAAYLTGWHRRLSKIEDLDTPRLVQEVASLIETPIESYEIMIAFERPPGDAAPKPPQWRTAPEARSWLSDHGFRAVRQHGALVLNVPARDAFSAAEQASQVADRLVARSVVGSRDRVAFLLQAFVADRSAPLPMTTARRAEVRALDREGALLRLDEPGPIDQSLELLANMHDAPDAVAAAAGWSAVESLLNGPGDEDKLVTAGRLADLVACSWPRAELTTIAWGRAAQSGVAQDALAKELQDMATNRERASRILRSIRDSEDIALVRSSDRMALRRMEKLVTAPRVQLLSVQARAMTCLGRLYRQRNLVVHGGRTAGFSLNMALKVAAPLVGAGLDRVAHAGLVDGRAPLELAARARFEIHRAGSQGATELTSLLE